VHERLGDVVDLVDLVDLTGAVRSCRCGIVLPSSSIGQLEGGRSPPSMIAGPVVTLLSPVVAAGKQ
jgi:hypothetical protein